MDKISHGRNSVEFRIASRYILLPCTTFLGLVWNLSVGLSQDVASSQVAPSSEEVLPQGFLEIILAGGGVGLAIIGVLIGLSLTMAYLVFEHLMTIRRNTLIPPGLADQVRVSLAAGRLTEANEGCRSKPCLLSFVLLHGLAEIEGGWPAVEKAAEDALSEQASRLFRKIEYLSVIGNIAPMVGLLGTVIGMILAFQKVADTQGTAGAGQLAEGIYQALVTTVGGLVVAIPSLGAFAVFRNWVDQLVAESAYVTQHALAPLKRLKSSQPGR